MNRSDTLTDRLNTKADRVWTHRQSGKCPHGTFIENIDKTARCADCGKVYKSLEAAMDSFDRKFNRG